MHKKPVPVDVAWQMEQGLKRMPRKWRNQPTVVDGIRFDSKKEAERWGVLRLLEQAGEIQDLERQVRFPLIVERELICHYVADFRYRKLEDDWIDPFSETPETPAKVLVTVVEDVKGVKTPEYKLKAKLMKACYGIEIREV